MRRTPGPPVLLGRRACCLQDGPSLGFHGARVVGGADTQARFHLGREAADGDGDGGSAGMKWIGSRMCRDDHFHLRQCRGQEISMLVDGSQAFDSTGSVSVTFRPDRLHLFDRSSERRLG